MNEWFTPLVRWIADLPVDALVRFVVIIVVGSLLARVIPSRLTLPLVPEPRTLLLRKLLRYTILGGTLAWSLRQLGFDLSVLLGAAGLLTVAVGFAAQTSASNLVSGVFLLWEQPFSVGDLIEVDNAKGTVTSIDTLSVKLRTLDNLLVRIPNEIMLKSKVTNLTRYPIRRIDLLIGVSYREHLERVEEVLMRVAEENTACLREPKPLFIFRQFSESSVDFQFSVWGLTSDFVSLKNAMARSILRSFAAEGIEIPFPQRTVHIKSPEALPKQSNESPTRTG